MKNPYVKIFFVSILFAALLWFMDDDPPYPDIKDTVIEMVSVGTVYIVIFWCIISGLYLLFRRKRYS